MIRVLDARFLTTGVRPEQYPHVPHPEIAFAGRSNVGKSSMINALAERKKLVRVSNTPGRTRTLNFFEVDLEQGKERRTVSLADLPGYGFAKVSKAERASWERMITTYLAERKPLQLWVSIIDGEIGPTESDIQTLKYLGSSRRAVMVVATKIDRVPKAQRKPHLREWAKMLRVDESVVFPFSATEKIGVQDVWATVWQTLF